MAQKRLRRPISSYFGLPCYDCRNLVSPMHDICSQCGARHPIRIPCCSAIFFAMLSTIVIQTIQTIQ